MAEEQEILVQMFAEFSEKATKFKKEINMWFTDYSKAFDCIDHVKLWNVLRKMGIPEHLIVLMRNLYTDQQATVTTENGQTAWFNIGKQARQDCPSSPSLFKLYAERELEATSDSFYLHISRHP